MQKIVINASFGGFGLSEAAITYMGISQDEEYGIKRDDTRLVECVEVLGAYASGRYAELKVIEIPDGVEWIIQDYDGNEWVAEQHEIWS